MVELKEFQRLGTMDSIVQSNKYSQEVIANCYSLYRLYRSAPKVSELTGINEQTIRSWAQKIERNNELREAYNEISKEINDDLIGNIEVTMQSALQQVYEKLPQASAAQAATIFGILFDKRNIMLGNATQSATNVYIDTSGMDDESKADLLRRALSRTEMVESKANAVDVDIEDDMEE